MFRAPPRSPILFASDTPSVTDGAVQALRAAGFEVVAARTLEESQRQLEAATELLPILFVDMTGGGRAKWMELVANLARRRPNPGHLLVTCAHGEAHLRELLTSVARPLNFLNVSRGHQDWTDLPVTVEKLRGGELFGIQRYLHAHAAIETFSITQSRQRQPLLAAAESFALTAGASERLASDVVLVAEELITNALYNAPVDSLGVRRFATCPRSRAVELSPNEAACFSLASDGRKMGLCVTDPFGSLTREEVASYMARCFAKGKNQISSAPGGAGLGLYSLFNRVHHFVINIAPGRRTEMMGLIELTHTYREHAKRPRSLNVFVAQ